MNQELLHNYYQAGNTVLATGEFELGDDSLGSVTVTVLSGGTVSDTVKLQTSDDGINWITASSPTVTLAAAPYVVRGTWSGTSAVYQRYARLLITTGTAAAVIINVSVSTKSGS